MAWPASLPDKSPGEVLTAADVDAIVDALDVTGGTWASYTPTITASTTDPTLGNTAIAGYYRKTGKTCDIDIDITIGSTFSAGSGAYRFSFPSGIVPLLNTASRPLGLVHVRDVSPLAASTHNAYYFSSTSFAVTNASGTLLGATSPITWATGDIISVHIASMQIV